MTTAKLLETQTLDASQFTIDDRYQRDPRDREYELKRMIADRFDPQLFDPIHVTKRRGGATVVIDGAGRCFAYYTLMGQKGKINCIVHPPMDIVEEAKLFVDLNSKRKRVGSGDMFKAEVVSGDLLACDIKRIFDAAGMTIGGASGPNNIASVSFVKEVYRRWGPDVLHYALDMKKAAWGEQTVSGAILAGLALFRTAFPNFPHSELRAIMMANLPNVIVEELKGDANKNTIVQRLIPFKAAHYLCTKWNYGRKNKRLDLAHLREVDSDAGGTNYYGKSEKRKYKHNPRLQ